MILSLLTILFHLLIIRGLDTKTENELPSPGHVKDTYPVLVWGNNNFHAMNMDTNQTLNCHIPPYPVDLKESGVATFFRGNRIIVCGGIPEGMENPWFDLCFEYYGTGIWKLSADFWGRLPESGKYFVPSVTKVMEFYSGEGYWAHTLWAISSEYPVNHIYRNGAWVPGPALPVDGNFCAMEYKNTSSIMITGGLIDGIPTNKVFIYNLETEEWDDFAPLHQPYTNHMCAYSGSKAMVIKEREMSEVLDTIHHPDMWQQNDDNHFGYDDFDYGNLLPYNIHKSENFGFINIAHNGPDDWMFYNGTAWVYGWNPINPDMKLGAWQLIVPSYFLQDCD